MPLFTISDGQLKAVRQKNFAKEYQLQKLIEPNLGPLFNCRFVASEFSTGIVHSGRIDTLALSEESNPVIIEYKKVESSQLINQSLFYLYWLKDHRGDFELAAKKQLGDKIIVDWSQIRVICIAPNFKRYDVHAVQVMGADIELWRYRLFENNTLHMEEIFQQSVSANPNLDSGKNPVMVAAGKKAALTRATATYEFDEHLKGKPESIISLALSIQEYIMGLDSAFEEVPKKNYVAYKISQNIACMEIQHKRVALFLKLKPEEFAPLPKIGRDVSNIGHYGTGDLELSLTTEDDFEDAKAFIESAYQQVGG